MLFIISAVVYFKLSYDFTKAIRLGVLSGFFIGVFISFFIAIFLLMIRSGKQAKHNVIKEPQRRNHIESKITKKQTLSHSPLSKESSSVGIKTPLKTYTQKTMLLMDHELAYEVAIHAIDEEELGTVTTNEEGKKHMIITTKNETIDLSILPLTRHTTQVFIESNPDSENTQKIIKYLKEKELSFLQY
jgi:predicted transcriptional regulator